MSRFCVANIFLAFTCRALQAPNFGRRDQYLRGGGGQIRNSCIDLSQLWSLVTFLIAGQDEEQNQGSGSDVDLLWDSSSEVDLRERLDIRRNGFRFWKSS
jgi:hypothetical protein